MQTTIVLDTSKTIDDGPNGAGVPVLEKFPALKWYPQQEEWIRDPHGSDNACFNYPLALRIQGPLDREALRLGLEEIVRRHQVFRSIFRLEGQEVMQMVLPPCAFSMAEESLESLADEERHDHVLRLAVQDAQRPFDLTREPLLRAVLLRTGAQEHVLLLTTHHFACDDWSTNILLGELAQLYSAFFRGRLSPLREISYHYSDFVRQHASEIQGEELESRLQYWKRQFTGGAGFHYVAPDFPRPKVQTFRGKHEEMVFPAELDRAVKSFSQSHGLSPFMTLVAAFQCLFGRYSGSADVGVGICVANRNQVEAEELIGPFSNRLLLRANVAGTLTVLEMLEGVRDAAWEAYSCQEVPCGELVTKSAPAMEPGSNRVFQAMIVLENAPKHPCEFSGLKVSRFPFDTGTACYDLHVWLRNQDGLQIAVQYDADLFAPETIRQIVNDYQGILEAMVNNPQGLVEDLPVSTPARAEAAAADEDGVLCACEIN